MLKEYELFVAAVECGSLSAAGRRLRLSPATASKQLAKLEGRLGVRLLNRTTRQILATDIGELFYERAASVLAAAREAEALAVGRSRTPNGRFRVTCPTSLTRIHLAPIFASFADKHPDLQLELEVSDAFSAMVSERIDFGIRVTNKVEPGLMSCRLAQDRRYLCAAPSYLADYGRPRDLADLSNHLLLAANQQWPWRLQGPEGIVEYSGHSRIATNSNELVREFALNGLGIALRSTWDIAEHLRSGALEILLPQYMGAPDTAILAIYPSSPFVPPNVRAFIKHLKYEIGDLPYWDRNLPIPHPDRGGACAVAA